FDLAIEYGKDTYVSLKHVGSRVLVRMFALKSWANGVFAKLPGMGPSVADAISQKLFSLVPEQIPARLLKYRDRFGHHLVGGVSPRRLGGCGERFDRLLWVVVRGSRREPAAQLLEVFFAGPAHEGEVCECGADVAKRATLIRFGVASAASRYYVMHRAEASAI